MVSLRTLCEKLQCKTESCFISYCNWVLVILPKIQISKYEHCFKIFIIILNLLRFSIFLHNYLRINKIYC